MGEGDKAQWDWVTSIYSILQKLPSQKVSSAQKSLCLHVYQEFFFLVKKLFFEKSFEQNTVDTILFYLHTS